jgi:esterase/lipase superfamily enzyme
MLKPIRFFATNRDRENLGRSIDRDQRIHLQKGGYHWIDMKKYMAHYLATTDPSTITPNAIVPDSQETIFQHFLGQSSVKRIIIGIHGFNVPFYGALTSFSVLADTLSQSLENRGSTLITEPVVSEEYKDGGISLTYDPRLSDSNQDITAFVGFSWPSKGNVFDYQSDRTDALRSAPALANLICYMRTQNPSAKIYIIAHSMGNYLTCNMLGGLVNQDFSPMPELRNEEIDKQLKRIDKGGSNSFFVDRYLMLAPDVERREVTQCDVDGIPNGKSDYIGPFYAGIKNLVAQTHLFYSRYDNVLKASVAEKEIVNESLQKISELFSKPDPQKRWEDSLGLNPLPALAPDNMYSHNATVLTNRAIDHGDYFDASAIADKIAELIMQVD